MSMCHYDATTARDRVSDGDPLRPDDPEETGDRFVALSVGAALSPLPGPVDRVGGSMWLDREDWGIVLDALIEHRASAEHRKAVNTESTSDVRVDTCVRLIRTMGAWLAVPPAQDSSQVSRTAGRVQGGAR